MKGKQSFFTSPYTVMCVVLLMYVVKVTGKLTIGHMVDSPMIQGDGIHNIADIFEALVVVATIWFSRLPRSETYPLGRKNIESLFATAVGGLLLVAGVTIILKSIFSLVGVITSRFTPEPMQGMGANLAIGITLGSAILSLLVSRYQIKIGKRSGHESLIADGEETASDGRIELTTFAGVCGEILFHTPWIEYPFAVFVGVLMIRTGLQVIGRGLGALLQRSIGIQHEAGIIGVVENIYGVHSVGQIKTFRTGDKVVVILKVYTDVAAEAHRPIKSAIAERMREYLREHGFTDWEFFIRFNEPPSDFHRCAVFLSYTLERPGVEENIDHASHVIVCDVERGRVTRATEHKIDKSGQYWEIHDRLIVFLCRKRVDVVVLYSPRPEDARQIIAWLPPKIRVEYGSSPYLSVYDL